MAAVSAALLGQVSAEQPLDHPQVHSEGIVLPSPDGRRCGVLYTAGEQTHLWIVSRDAAAAPTPIRGIVSAAWDKSKDVIFCVSGGPKEWCLQERDVTRGVLTESRSFQADRICRASQLDDGSVCVLARRDDKGLLVRWPSPRMPLHIVGFPDGVLPDSDWTIPKERSSGQAVIASNHASVLVGLNPETQRWGYAKSNGRRGWDWTPITGPRELEEAAHGWQSPIRRPNVFLSDPSGQGAVLFWNPLLPVFVEGGSSVLPNNLLAPLDLTQSRYGPRRFSDLAQNPGRYNWEVPAGTPGGISFSHNREQALLRYPEPIKEQKGGYRLTRLSDLRGLQNC